MQSMIGSEDECETKERDFSIPINQKMNAEHRRERVFNSDQSENEAEHRRELRPSHGGSLHFTHVPPTVAVGGIFYRHTDACIYQAVRVGR